MALMELPQTAKNWQAVIMIITHVPVLVSHGLTRYHTAVHVGYYWGPAVLTETSNFMLLIFGAYS